MLERFKQTAINAHRWTSFDPDKRGEQTVKEFGDELTADLETLPEQEREQYRQKYETLFAKWLNSKSRCASPMITGPANFPARRMEKYNNWERNAYQAFRDWRERALKAILTPKKEPLTMGDELAQQREKLEKLKTNHELMKKINEVMRGKGNKEEQLKALGISEKLTAEILQQNEVFTFELRNNLANIKRVEDRVKELQHKTEKAETVQQFDVPFPSGATLEAGTVRVNYEQNRIQILFDGKPNEQTRNALKKRAFKWAPSQNAWQRLLTGNAIFDTEQLTGVKLRKAPTEQQAAIL